MPESASADCLGSQESTKIMFLRIYRLIHRWAFASTGVLYLLTFGLLNPEHRKFLYQIPQYFGYQPTRLLIPQIAPSEIVSAETMLTLARPLQGGGEVTLLELVCINALIHHRRPQRLLEIGTLGGRTTLNMVANTDPTAEVSTLDLPSSENRSQNTSEEMLGRKWTQLYGDSLTFDFSAMYGSMDFIFIDANHSYEHVRSDSLQSLKMLRDGTGVIVWHDYGSWDWEGNTRALNELYTTEPGFRGLRHVQGTSLVCLINPARQQ